jgi:hypothetical protein
MMMSFWFVMVLDLGAKKLLYEKVFKMFQEIGNREQEK